MYVSESIKCFQAKGGVYAGSRKPELFGPTYFQCREAS